MNIGELNYLHEDDEYKTQKYEHLHDEYLQHSGKDYIKYINGRDHYNHKM